MKTPFRLTVAPMFLVALTIAAVGCARTPNNGAQAKPGSGPAKPGAATPSSPTAAGGDVAPKGEARTGDSTLSLNLKPVLEDEKLTPEQKGEQAALVAQQLFNAQAFDLADTTADLALKTDPKNLRAKLLKALMKPFLVQRGIVGRLAPLAGHDARLKDKYDRLMVKVDEKLPITNLREFLKNGPADIATEAQLQAHLDATADSFKQLREFLKANKDNTITMSLSENLAEPLMRRLARACNVVQKSELEFDVSCPSTYKEIVVTLNRADFEALQHAAAGSEIAVSIGNSYDISGAIAVAQAHSNDSVSSLSAQSIVQEALKNAKFATLRSAAGFNRLKDMGAEAVAGVRFLVDNKESACPKGSADSVNRIGMVVDSDLCTLAQESEVQKVVEAVETSTGGGVLKFSRVELKPMAWIASPIADLRTQLPTLDNCGQITTWKDQTFGSLLASGSANDFLSVKACSK